MRQRCSAQSTLTAYFTFNSHNPAALRLHGSVRNRGGEKKKKEEEERNAEKKLQHRVRSCVCALGQVALRTRCGWLKPGCTYLNRGSGGEGGRPGDDGAHPRRIHTHTHTEMFSCRLLVRASSSSLHQVPPSSSNTHSAWCDGWSRWVGWWDGGLSEQLYVGFLCGRSLSVVRPLLLIAPAVWRSPGSSSTGLLSQQRLLSSLRRHVTSYRLSKPGDRLSLPLPSPLSLSPNLSVFL